jgi:hypothetical protein
MSQRKAEGLKAKRLKNAVTEVGLRGLADVREPE